MLHAVSAIPSMPKPLHVPMDKGRASTFLKKNPHGTWDMGHGTSTGRINE